MMVISFLLSHYKLQAKVDTKIQDNINQKKRDIKSEYYIRT